jgi:dynein heavy chain
MYTQITQGHVRGITCLPLPSSTSNDSEKNNDECNEDYNLKSYSQVHTLESAIITWTKQIKNVLKQDPEMVFQSMEDPGL